MNLISISNDKKIFVPGSPVQQRMIEYGSLFDQLHVVVFTKKGTFPQKRVQISSRVWLYSTESSYRGLYVFQAYSIIRHIIQNRGFVAANTVVTVQDPSETGVAGFLVGKIFSLPLHIQIHTDIFNPYFLGVSWGNRFRAVVARLILPTASGVRVVSQKIARSIEASGIRLRCKVSVIPIWVDVERYQNFEITVNAKEKYSQFSHLILVASRLVEEKNIGYAIQVLKQIVKTHPRVGMLVVGEGPERARLKDLVKRLDLENNVVWEPWTNELGSYFKTVDVYFVTSFFEGYGMAIVEAVSAGCAVVSTNVGVASEVLPPEALVSQGDINEGVEKVVRMLDDMPSRQKSIRESGVNLTKISMPRQTYLDMYKKDIEQAQVVFSSKRG